MRQQTGSFLAFNREWFQNNQRLLLWLLNHYFTKRWFRHVLGIKKGDIGYNQEIIQLFPNAYVIGKDGQFMAEFSTYVKYAKKLYYAFQPLWWTMHFWDWIFADRFAPKLSFGFSTLTVYPNPDTETTSVDGYVEYADFSSATWAQVHDAADGTSAGDSNANGNVGAGKVLTGFYIDRVFLLFDTSALTAGATISAAVLSVYVTTKSNSDNDGQDYINVYTTTPASNTEITTADYDQIGTTAQATAIDLGAISTSAYNDWTLNATGLSNISKTGVSKFGLREGHDAENAAIATGENYFTMQFADTADTTQDPKLVITYTAIDGPANVKTYNGVTAANTKTVNSIAIASVKTKNGVA